MKFLQRSSEYLNSTRTTGFLVALHVAMLLVVVYIPQPPSPDEMTYMSLAESMEHGSYSVWYGEYDPAPIEVHRTHGYPAFLLAIRSISSSKMLLRAVQATLHLLTLLIGVHYLRRSPLATYKANSFLFLMLPQLQLLYYVGQVFPEVLISFFLTALALSYTSHGVRPFHTVLRIVLLGAAFWVRPIVLLLPLFILIADLLLLRGMARLSAFKRHAIVALGFALVAPIPFGLWNLKSHGRFSPVPLTGSAVISNLGLWQLRLPGYGTIRYFQYNTFGREFIPWVDTSTAATYFAQYEAQWDRIEERAAPYMSTADMERVPRMMEHPWLWATRSADYTVALDRAIAKENLAMVKAEPFYYLVTRLYTAARLWITNINLPMERTIYRVTPGVHPIVGRPQNASGWVMACVPFAVTFFSFGLGLPFLMISVWRNRRVWFERRYLLYVIAYVWFVHIPMAIQSRYTVPVHVLAILCITLALTDRSEPQVK